MEKSKQQSAMEYLMTYGWSILIIAIVLAALFSLGVFGNSNLGPRAQPNSCRVYRPNGPGTTTNINLEGVCNGELPAYVAQFNGQTSNVLVSSSLVTGNQITFAVWEETLGVGSVPNAYILGGQSITNLICLNTVFQPSFQVELSTGSFVEAVAQQSCPSNGVWTQWVGTYNGVTALLYMNGVSVASNSLAGTTVKQGSVVFGQNPASINSYVFNGLEANIQLYSTALDANAVQALYLEGIGGAPVEPQNLVGWWPLNGDANDYSGDGNNGAAANLAYVSSWAQGYTTP